MAPRSAISLAQIEAAREYLATLERSELEDCVLSIVAESIAIGTKLGIVTHTTQ